MGGKVAPIAKIARPTLLRILNRERLFRLLCSSQKCPITWVSGHAGCGKTTFVSSYISRRRAPCIWYQVDEGDQDYATFFHYLGLAVKRASGNGKTFPALTPEYLQDIPTFSRQFFENAFLGLTPSTIFVFDNYQMIPSESGLHDVLIQGLSAVPEGFRIILISRNAPPPAWVRLQANRLIQVLGWEELRLTLAESGGIVRLMAPAIQSEQQIERLHTGADGWAAGLVLMLESVRRGMDPNVLSKTTPEEIVQYFGKEIFEKIDREHRELFLNTAFLPKMTARMAEDITGLSSAGSILSGLTRQNYFISKRHQTEPIYEYHPLFRDFLIVTAKEAFPSGRLNDLISRSAALLEKAGQTEEAVNLLIDLKDWGELANLVLKHAPVMMAQGRWKPLGEWIDHFPREIMEDIPWLLYWLGLCNIFVAPGKARLRMEHAFKLFESRRDRPGTLLAWAGVVECIMYEWNDFRSLDQWIAWLDREMGKKLSFPSLEIEARVLSGMTGAVIWRQTNRPDIEKWLSRALETSRQVGDVNLRLTNQIWAMTYYTWRTDIGKLNILLDETRRMASDPSASPLIAIASKCTEAVSLTINSANESLQASLRGMEIAQKTGVHLMDHMLCGNGIYASFSIGDLGKAKEFLKMIGAALEDGKRNSSAYYHWLAGWYDFIQGEIPKAVSHAEKAREFARETGPVQEMMIGHLMAHLDHKRGRDEAVSAHLAMASKMNETGRYPILRYVHLLTEAEFALERGDESRALKALQEGMSLGKDLGFKTMIYIWRPSVMAHLCATALRHKIEVDYVQTLIRTLDLLPEESSTDLQSWPWHLKIYTLGRFELIRDGKPVQYSRKAQGKPLSLLKALIALGEKEVRSEELADLLWPEADGDLAYDSFQVTLHRARSLIGYSDALQLREGRLTLNRRYCWVDAWAFERLLQQADAGWSGRAFTSAVSLTEKAFALYGGPFLTQDAEEPWAISTHERIRGKYLRAVARVGEHWARAREWEKARDWFQRGLDVDDLAEGFCQELMTCYQNLGQKGEALLLYQRFEKRMKTILRVEPAAKTKALRDAMKKSS